MTSSSKTDGDKRGGVPAEHMAGVARAYWKLQGLRDPGQLVLSAATTVCITVASMHGLPGGLEPRQILEWSGLKWALAAVVLGVISAFAIFKWFKPTYSELAQQRAHAVEQMNQAKEAAADEVRQHRDALQGALDELLVQLATYVCDDTVDTRVSVYSVEGDEFLLLARYSKNPNHERRGRSSYPLNQGAIGVAWARQWVIQNSSEETREGWEESLLEQGFSSEEARHLSMHSRSIYAHRLDRGSAKAGVVVFEAEDENRFTAKTVSKVERSFLRETLAAVVNASHVYFPRVHERQQEIAGAPVISLVPEPRWKRTEQPSQASIVIASQTSGS